jgi:hypothetical protein
MPLFLGRFATPLLGVCCWTLLAGTAGADPKYNIQLLGLTDPEHTRADGYRYSNWIDFNDHAEVAGFSYRYLGSQQVGESAWYFDGKRTQKIGIVDDEHRLNNYRYNRPISLTEDGQVLGSAHRYVGTGVDANFFGISSWVFDEHAGTRRIGLFDAAHTQTGGYQYSYGFKQNESRQVIGFARRYNGSSYIGQSAWVFENGATSEIGLLGAGSSSSTGERYHEPYDINDAGQIIGFSGRYAGADYRGHATWLRSRKAQTVTTIDVGLADAAHTRADGYRDSLPRALSKNGHVAGVAERFAGSTYMGQPSWVYDGTQTRVINPQDAEHTRSDGTRNSGSVFVYGAWPVLGFSLRYYGAADSGQTRWLYNGNVATANVGLTDAAHTIGATRFNTPFALTETGVAVGYADQLATRDGGARGQSAWIYKGGATRRVGLYDDLHTHDAGGGQSNTPQQVNLLGQVAGDALRFNGNTLAGYTAWFYEPTLDRTVPLEFSVSAAGQAHSTVQYLSETGVALGQYIKYDGNSILGQRAFYWSMDDGFFDLGTLVNGGLSTQGWERLFESTKVNGNGQLIGKGLYNGSFPLVADALVAADTAAVAGDLVYLMSPVPEPASGVALLVLAAVAATVRRRRRQI